MNKNILKNLDVVIPFTDDIKQRVHGRGLVKDLDLSQKAIQNRLNRLEEEGVLKSEVSGRTKQFRLNPENILTRKVVTMVEMMKFYDLVSQSFEIKEMITEILKATESYVLVYGSFADGTWDEESDLDVLIVGESKGSLKEIDEKYSREIHFMVLSEKEFKEGIKGNKPYIAEVLQNHIICRGFEKITPWRFENE